MGINTFKPERIKTVFFDINETLVDPESTFRQAFAEVWDDLSGRWDTDGDKPGADEVWQAFLQRSPRGSLVSRSYSYAEQERRNTAAMSAALGEWEIRLPESAMHAFFHKVNEQQEKAPLLYPGTAETLSVLARNFNLAIISNGKPDKQIRRLKAAGLFPLLKEDLMFFSSAVGVRKPHPAIFRHALERMGIRPDQAVMVGNSWSKDILGAIQAHLHAVWFRPGRKQKHFRRKVGSARIHVVQSMEQLLSLFESPAGTQQPSK